MLLATVPGVACLYRNVAGLPRGSGEAIPALGSLANYWGLTPGCRNSGKNNKRLGHITKAGSSIVRWLLAQATHKVLRKDARLREWFHA